MASAGTQTSALCIGGGDSPGLVALTEEWNGASWVEVADLSTAKDSLGGTGTTANAIAFGGVTPSVSATTEEWSGSSTVTKTVSTD